MGRKRKINSELPNKIVAIIFLAMAVAFILDILGFSIDSIRAIVNWILGSIGGVIASFIAGLFVKEVTGDTLKKIALNISISKNINFSITAFFVATIILRYTLFAGL